MRALSELGQRELASYSMEERVTYARPRWRTISDG